MRSPNRQTMERDSTKMTAHLTERSASPPFRHGGALPIVILVLLTIVAAAPALWGEFLGGDDRSLLLNHALVNHPTRENVLKLFSVEAQRDLYQPLPLLTFAAEFKLVRWLNLPLSSEGRGAATLLFHGTNVALHVTNVVLAYLLIRRVGKCTFVALVAAVLLAIHPLSVESYAWLNGRMTLLSVFFVLLTLLFMQTLLTRPSGWAIVGAVIAAVLAMCSKVRMELPILVLLLPFAQQVKPPRRWWGGLATVTAVTVAFAVLNISTTVEEGMFEGAGQLQGSRLARTCITLGWYLRALVWPTALSPYYPTDYVVQWNHPLIPISVLFVLGALAAILVSLRWTLLGLIGAIWFLMSVGPTLPLLPSRNLMAADRYVYFANVGVYAFLAWVSFSVYQRFRVSRARRYVFVLTCAAVVALLVGLSWRQARYYHSDVRRYARIAELNPNRAGSWERLGWAHYEAGNYQQAMTVSQRELAHEDTSRHASVDQLVGMSLARLGRVDEAVAKLQHAVDRSPDDAKARTRLAKVLADAGRSDEAVEQYRRAVELNPTLNPAIVQLADLLRKDGKLDSAASYYELALTNNAYDANSIMGLAEIDMARGAYASAIPRLESLLKWMPQNATARTNLGVCHAQLGRVNVAMSQYRAALEIEPGWPVAAVNLSLLLVQSSATGDAMRIMGESLARFPTDTTALIGYQDVCAAAGKRHEAVEAWRRAAKRLPDSRLIAGWLAWSAAIAESRDAASLLQPLETHPSTPMRLAHAFDAMRHHDPEPMIELIRGPASSPPDMADALDRLMQALADYGVNHSEEVWPYYLIAEILVAKHDPRAEAALSAFEQICRQDECRTRTAGLRAIIKGGSLPQSDK